MFRTLSLFVCLCSIALSQTIEHDSLLRKLADSIAVHEGWYGGSFTWKLHNPGALAYLGQNGAVAGVGGYARFSSSQAGWNALYVDLQGKLRHRGMTLRKLMRVWATGAGYLDGLVKDTGYGPDTVLP